MNLTRDRLQSIGWAVVLSVCAALLAGLTLRVNAVKSQVHQTELRIVRLRQEMTSLETEYQTRSNQHQLTALNALEFGYNAPRAEQYIEGERHLAALGKPRAPGAPSPIRLAYGDREAKPDGGAAAILSMVSPLTGVPVRSSDGSAQRRAVENATGGGEVAVDPVKAAIDAASLGDRLARIEPAEADTR